MTERVWKYALIPIRAARHDLRIPISYKRSGHVGLQRGVPCLWLHIQDELTPERWLFQWVGTGADRAAEGVPQWALYMGTVLLEHDDLVLHGYLWQPQANA